MKAETPTNTKAFIFDLNGTMIDDMGYHIEAWHTILNHLGAGITLARVKDECYGKNHELLERIFPGRFSFAEKDTLSFDKEKAYQKAFRPKLKLLKGLDEFLESGHEAGIRMAIASAAIMFNINFAIDGTGTGKYFDAVVSADDVKTSKPDPETFLLAANKLHVLPEECIVFEDAPKGVEAALNAGMKAVVITTVHEPNDFKQYPNVIKFASDFISLKNLIPKPASLLSP